MALLERVATLIRANLNDLIDRAEDPEKMLKQVILDMQNQLIQVKTQVAIAIADQHVLRMKLQENNQAGIDWLRKAEIAVEKQQDELARPALERVLSYKKISASFHQQLEDHSVQVENLKAALQKLEQKLIEAKMRAELLASRHRTARVLGKSADATAALTEGDGTAVFQRMNDKVQRAEALNLAKNEIADASTHDRLLTLSRQDEVDQLLEEIKSRKNVTAISDH